MTQYQYNGEHYHVTIEGISFTKGEVTNLTEDDEKILLNSGFGKAMIESGELKKVGEISPDDNKEAGKKKPTKKDENVDVVEP